MKVAAQPRGPVLIEANVGRWHGVPYSVSLGNMAQGYNGFGAVLDAALDPEAWSRIPARPVRRARARMVHLALSRVGRVVRVSLPEIGDPSLPSLVEAEAKYEVGDVVSRPSTDLKSDGGHVVLVSQDAAALEADYERVLAMQPAFFELEEAGVDEGERQPYDVPTFVRALLAADRSLEGEAEAAPAGSPTRSQPRASREEPAVHK